MQQEQMPVEETANMHLMLAAIAQQKGNSTDFIDPKYWPLLRIWADYLVSTTYDPADQLCTDGARNTCRANTCRENTCHRQLFTAFPCVLTPFAA